MYYLMGINELLQKTNYRMIVNSEKQTLTLAHNITNNKLAFNHEQAAIKFLESLLTSWEKR